MRFLLTRRWIQYIAFALVAAVACVLLANWQNERREARDAAIERIEANYGAAPRPLADVLPSPDAEFSAESEWARISVEGTYRTEDALIARNRPKDGRAGSWELVPFDTAEGVSLLVARGWVAGSGMDVSPADLTEPPEGEVTLTAWLRPSQEGEEGQTTEASDASVATVRALDPDLILGADAGAHYSQAYAYLDAEEPAPAEAPEALPAPDTDPGSHLSYTMQWIAFAVMILIGLLVAVRRERAAIRRGERAPDAGPARRGLDPEKEYEVVDKDALRAGARRPAAHTSRPVVRRPEPQRRRSRGAEAEDAALEEQLR